jgi:uncharacterized protein YndB with AHSA1/START domain
LDESVNLSAWLGCSVKQAFKMFTNKEHLTSWLPVVSNIEPKVGGKYDISLSTEKSPIGSKILVYEPNKCLTFEWKGPGNKSIKNKTPLDTEVMIQFLPMGSKKISKDEFTEVLLTLTSFNDPNNDEEAKLWLETSWANAFEKLVVHVNDIFQ